MLASALWLGAKAGSIKDDLESAAQSVPQLKDDVLRDDIEAATATLENLKEHTASARNAANDPLWTMAGMLPWLGGNFRAVSEVATSADDVAQLGAAPLVQVLNTLDWKTLLPSNTGVDLKPLAGAAPKLSSAAHAVRQSSDRLNNIDTSSLLPQVASPLILAREQLQSMRGGLDTAASVAGIAPEMMGDQGSRRYLLLIQNNAEARATGGIPGALAVLTVDQGKLSLGSQTSATALGAFTPSLPVDPEQVGIYSTRLGKFMQDANLTPDFPTTASTARAMWKSKYGDDVDGVLSIDPVSLGYILDAIGPVELSDPQLRALAGSSLPTKLDGANVTRTLLSDVYAKIPEPKMQDVYFAGVAQEIFSSLSAGQGDPKGLIEGITRGTAEGRFLVWSVHKAEQDVISTYPVSGAIAGPSVAPAQFGVYFNDGTGAKMDYYVKRTVQLVQECTGDEYGQVKVRITSTNTAPADAATSLPEYVTAGGAYGVPAGSVQTNVIAYGPIQANVENAVVDGKKADFASYMHSNRPVGSVTVALAPGQTSTVDLTFGKIVQHTEPKLVVTPTVQPVKDVVLSTTTAECVPGK
ncbi:hypothetical protein JOE40_002167 [Arthrobacter sp. PvP102]|uniref:DUF4012 domain-containing protein n=1 Tax=unclassified Arthrobacter TaxID=235627 RepID=UPI001AE31FC4|nr:MULTISPECIES: DUF4012 domain-containing protein [unclassified Arthrobacter]MBP1232523.1 hypothetical protein [Arthrobacter sp. PvP103]MBP1237658.1 hypothetical protein [Arthrobacter sp. PvP102]